MVSVHSLGAGRFVLNTLHVRENLGRNPAADRLLVNMLRYAGRDAAKALLDLPADFESQLKTLGSDIWTQPPYDMIGFSV